MRRDLNLVIPVVPARCRLCVGDHAVEPLDCGNHAGRPASDQAEQGRESVDHERVDVAPVPVVEQRHGDRRERVDLAGRNAQSNELARDAGWRTSSGRTGTSG